MSLLNKLKDVLSPDRAQQNEPDGMQALQMASAALLIEVSHADFDTDQRELDAASSKLALRYHLDINDAQALLAEALAQHRESVSIYEYLSVINERMSPEEKIRLIEDLWFVAHADQSVDPHEEHQIRKIADLLHVPHTYFVRGRYRAASNRT